MTDSETQALDLQVNGYAGCDFNSDDLSADSLHNACERLDKEVDGILATVISDDLDRMSARLARLNELRQQDPLAEKIIRGFHIEGPFISSVAGYIGAHPVEAAQDATIQGMQKLLDSANGLTKIVTLAPERDANAAVTRMLADQNICVSGGHCNPSLDELDAAIDAGMTMFTHLGNGCPLQMHRHDNIIQRVLSRSDRLWIGLIADGVHVPWPALGNYLRVAGIDRCVVVTDAISAAGLGAGRFRLGDQEVVVDEQGATWAADRSHLIGSASTMPQMVANLRGSLGLSDADVTQLTVKNPRSALGITC